MEKNKFESFIEMTHLSQTVLRAPIESIVNYPNQEKLINIYINPNPKYQFFCSNKAKCKKVKKLRLKNYPYLLKVKNYECTILNTNFPYTIIYKIF